MPGPSPLLTRSPISTASLINRSMPSFQPNQNGGPPATPLSYSNGTSNSSPGYSNSGPAGRSPSAGRVTGGSSGSLRATLHTDTLAGADRPRAPPPERNSQSAIESATAGSWRVGTGLPGSGPPAPGSYGMGYSNNNAPGGPGGIGGGLGTIPTYHKPPSFSSSPAAGLFSGGFPTTLSGPAGITGGGGAGDGAERSSLQSQGQQQQQQQHHQFTAVARVLAPNGQPRKVPISMLGQYQAARAEAAAATADVLSSSGSGGGAVGSGNGGRGATRSGSLSGAGMMLGMDPNAAKLKAVAALRYGLVSK